MKKRILIVEDHEINRRILSRIVSTKYEVVEAANGQEALEILEKEQENISLILLDIVMPVMDGYEFLKEWKKRQYDAIPVIVTTECSSESAEIAALMHGATEFIVKPYQPEIIMRRIGRMIQLRETSAMVYQLQYDRLTGLYSKEYFYQYARETKRQNPDRIYDFICLNIENFHLFNDRYGTKAGDRLLQTIAETYREILPEKEAAASRFYADHFIVMQEHQEQQLDRQIGQMIDAVERSYGSTPVTLKWGIYTDDGEELPIEKMCDYAVIAARSVKGQYGVHYGKFDQKMRNLLLEEQLIRDEMRQALAEEQFEVYLQPKVCPNTTECWTAAEALVRWNHPQKGILFPDSFIPVMEKARFISQLDRYVWKKVCELMRRWEEQGLGCISVSVNMSQINIADEDLIGYLEGLIRTYRLHPSQLHLEITETACTENQEEAELLIGRLRESGFVIEMDDFGSGYSSLNMLMQLPFDILKLDRSLIQHELKKKGGLSYIIGLAHWMNLKVVAEGIETKEQMDYMIGLGCDCIQGYYMAKPMHWKEFEKVLREQRGR